MDTICSGISLTFDNDGNAVVHEGRVEKPKKVHLLKKLIDKFFEVRTDIDGAIEREVYFDPSLCDVEFDIYQDIVKTFDGLFGHGHEERGDEWNVAAEDMHIVDEYFEKIVPLHSL